MAIVLLAIPSLQDRTPTGPASSVLSAEDPVRLQAIYTHPRMSRPEPRVSPGPEAIFPDFSLTLRHFSLKKSDILQSRG